MTNLNSFLKTSSWRAKTKPCRGLGDAPQRFVTIKQIESVPFVPASPQRAEMEPRRGSGDATQGFVIIKQIESVWQNEVISKNKNPPILKLYPIPFQILYHFT